MNQKKTKVGSRLGKQMRDGSRWMRIEGLELSDGSRTSMDCPELLPSATGIILSRD